MAGTGVELTIEESDAIEELKRKVPKAARILTDIERLADEFVFVQLRSHVQEVYATQGRAAGEAWDDYSSEPKYAGFKAGVLDFDTLPVGQNTPGGLLRWKGKERLYPSLTQTGHSEHLEDVDGMTIEFGTEVPYATRLAQTGGTGPKGEEYAPRPILSFSSNALQKFFRGIEAWFRGELKRAGIL